jgi:hypothetical protein
MGRLDLELFWWDSRGAIDLAFLQNCSACRRPPPAKHRDPHQIHAEFTGNLPCRRPRPRAARS